MATKILYNGNRIIIDGHADTAEECQAITAMCDSMLQSDDFETIVYEKGHAVFERVRGGESKMFDTLEDRVAALEALIGTLPEGKNTVVEYIDEAKTIGQSGLTKGTEGLLAAEAANAKASNAEQLAINAFYAAQEAAGVAQNTANNMSDAIKRAEDAANEAESWGKKAEDAADDAEEVGQAGLTKANEALLAAESAMAKASNGEQLALNALYAANEALGKIGTLAEGKNNVVEYIDEVRSTAEAVANAPEHKLPYTAAELEAKLSQL